MLSSHIYKACCWAINKREICDESLVPGPTRWCGTGSACASWWLCHLPTRGLGIWLMVPGWSPWGYPIYPRYIPLHPCNAWSYQPTLLGYPDDQNTHKQTISHYLIIFPMTYHMISLPNVSNSSSPLQKITEKTWVKVPTFLSSPVLQSRCRKRRSSRSCCTVMPRSSGRWMVLGSSGHGTGMLWSPGFG